jgi:hypothetical protein
MSQLASWIRFPQGEPCPSSSGCSMRYARTAVPVPYITHPHPSVSTPGNTFSHPQLNGALMPTVLEAEVHRALGTKGSTYYLTGPNIKRGVMGKQIVALRPTADVSGPILVLCCRDAPLDPEPPSGSRSPAAPAAAQPSHPSLPIPVSWLDAQFPGWTAPMPVQVKLEVSGTRLPEEYAAQVGLRRCAAQVGLRRTQSWNNHCCRSARTARALLRLTWRPRSHLRLPSASSAGAGRESGPLSPRWCRTWCR